MQNSLKYYISPILFVLLTTVIKGQDTLNDFKSELYKKSYNISIENGDTIYSFIPEIWDLNSASTQVEKSTDVKASRVSAYEDSYMDLSHIPESYAVDKSKDIGEIPIIQNSTNGALSYSVPIECYQSSDGINPSIQITYNSMSGNGVAGYGWEIGGLSAIKAVAKNMYFDGEPAAIATGDINSGVFELDGQRLIGLALDGSEKYFQTEQGYIKVKAYSSGAIIKYFNVYYTNGNVATYGYEDNTSIKFYYPLTKIKDSAGNVLIDYRYELYNEVYYICFIRYGSNNSYGLPYGCLTFYYEDRPDATTYYEGYNEFKKFKRLNSISNNYSRTYHFSYENSNVSMLKQIDYESKSKTLNPLIFYYGENNQLTGYNKKDVILSSYFSKASTPILNLQIGKFNKNGAIGGLISYPNLNTYGIVAIKKDFWGNTVGYEYGSTYHPNQNLLVYADLPSSLSTPAQLTAGDGFQILTDIDIDGDGKDELVKVNRVGDNANQGVKETYSVYNIQKNYSGGTSITTRYTFDLNYNTEYLSWDGVRGPKHKKYLVGDFLGNGKQSILEIPYEYKVDDVNLTGLKYFIDVENKSNYFVHTEEDGTLNLKQGDKVFVIDYNGDGKDEVVLIRQKTQTHYLIREDGTPNIYTDTYNKLEFYTLVKEYGITCDKYTLINIDSENIDLGETLFGDINNDGKTDVVVCPKRGYWASEYVGDCRQCDYCIYGEGTECENPIYTTSYVPGGNKWLIYYSSSVFFNKKEIISASNEKDTKFVLQDMNGDEKLDLVAENNGVLQIYSNLNGIFNSEADSQTISLSGGNEAVLIPGYLDSGNEHQQLFSIYNQELNIITSNRNIKAENLLTGMVTSTGVVYKNQYVSVLNSSENYNEGTDCIYPFRNISGNLFLHASTECFLSGNRISAISKNYTRGMVDLRRRKFIGFEQIQTNDEIRNTSTIQIFDPVNFGVLKSIDGTTASATYSYDISVAINKIAKVNLSSKIEIDKLKNVTVNTSYTYDVYGNPTNETIDYGNGLKVSIDNLYNNNAGSPYWYSSFPNIIGELYQQTVTKTRNEQNSIQKMYIESFDTPSRKPEKVLYYINNNLISETTNTYQNGKLTKESRKDFNKTTPIETSYVYDNNQQLIRKTNPLGLFEDYGYDNQGNLTTITDHKNHTTIFEYDEWGRKISTTNPDGIIQKISMQWIGSSGTNSGSSTTTNYGGAENNYNKDIEFSAPMSTGTAIAASNSITLSPGYSFKAETGGDLKLSIDKTVSVLPPPTMSGGSGSAEGDYIYLVTSRATGAPATQSYIDALGREVRSGSMRFDGNYLYSDKGYDDYGRLSQVSLPFKGSSPSLWNTYTYDDYDRPLSIAHASGKTDNFSYSGLSVSSTIDGITKTITKDATGKVVSVTDPAGTITYSIRPDGQPSSIVAPGNTTTSFEYDVYGRQTKIIDPSAGTKVYTYDAAGNLNSETDDRGKVTNTIYDGYNRITQKEIVGELTTTYNYNSDGQLETVSSNNGTGKNLTYDGFLRLSTVKDIAPDGKYLQKSFTYSSGIPTAVSYINQNGAIVTENYGYAYDTQTEIKLNNSTTVWKLTAENDMGLATASLTGGLTREYGYDAYGLPTSRMVKNGSNIIQDFGCNFNPSMGNLNWRRDNMRGLQENFDYDGLNRLTTFGGNTITYDTKGNITDHTAVGSFAYENPAKPYMVTAVTPYGTAIPLRDQNITYNGMQRPATISENGYVAAFAYDQIGQRVKMQLTHNGQTQLTRYYIGGQYELDAETGTERLYLGGDAYSAASVYVKEAGTWKIYYICRDYQGSITHVVNADGSLKQELSYDPWGRLRNPATQQVYAVGSEPALFLARGYTGHEQLSEFGLINMNARLYDAALGRFLSPDPYVQSPGNSQNFNRYSYCLNNPLAFTDPSGMSFKSWWKRNIADPFIAAVNRTFGFGQPGFQIGYNSAGGFFVNPTYNCASFGPSAYYSNGQVSYGNGSGGFHDNSSSVRLDRKFASSVVQAEQFAKGKMDVYSTMSKIWNEILDVPNVLFGNNSEYIYPTSHATYQSKEFLSAMGQSTTFTGSLIEHYKGSSALSTFESGIVRSGKAIDRYNTFIYSKNLLLDPTIDNLFDFSLDYISNKSFKLGWFSFWVSEVAPWAIEEINQEGYRSRDKRQLLEEQY